MFFIICLLFFKLGNGEFMFRKIKKNPLDCKEIKDVSKCFSFSRHNPRPFPLLSKHFHQWLSLGIWFLTLCLWPRLLCQDSDSSVTLPTQHLHVDVSREPQLNMVKTKFFYSSRTTQFFSNSLSEKKIPYSPNSMSLKPYPHPALLYT